MTDRTPDPRDSMHLPPLTEEEVATHREMLRMAYEDWIDKENFNGLLPEPKPLTLWHGLAVIIVGLVITAITWRLCQ